MNTKRVAVLAILTAASCALPQAARAQQRVTFYVTIEGAKQGKFKGESLPAAQKEKLAGLRFSYQVSAPHDAATGQASGKRQHSPVSFTKEWGAASPQLFEAAVTNEVLKSVIFEFVKTNAEGKQYVFQTIRLTNATVSSIRSIIGPLVPGDASDVRAYDEIALSFQSITIENTDGKTAAMDSWAAR